ncbi:MAG: CHAT domain-containing protein [Spirulina sp. SIO3F2]|nr:CHAT domain-containing protein [Spirulina sp. SIO3F2]
MAQAAIRPIAAPVEWGVGLADEALELPGEWLVAQGAETEEALRLYQEGRELLEQGTEESLRGAIEKFEAAIKFYEDNSIVFLGAIVRYWLGFTYVNLGYNREALSQYQVAFLIFEAATQQATGEDLETARSWRDKTLPNLGAVYNYLGEKQKAIEAYNRALSLSRESGNQSNEALTLNNIGMLYSSLGEKQRALEVYNQALYLLQKLEVRDGEAATLSNIGAVYSALGEKDQALNYFNQAIPLLRAIDNRHGEASALHNIGTVYLDLGEKKQALEYFEQALNLRKVVGDRGGEANTLNAIGVIYWDLGESTQALEIQNQALLLHQSVGDRTGEARSLNNIASIHMAGDNKKQALVYLEEALLLKRAVGDLAGEAVVLLNIGAIHSDAEEKDRALEYYNQALLLDRAVGNISGEVYTLWNIAAVQRSQNNLTAALTNIETAIALIEQLRAAAPAGELRQTYFAEQQGYYQFYTDLLMQLHQQNPDQGHDIEAFHISERSRARTLLELLAESQLNLRDDANSELLERERDLLAQLTAQQQLLTQRLGNAQTPEEQAQIRQDYTTATNRISSELDAVINQLKRQNPAYTDLKYPEPLDLAQVQQQILDEDTVLLQYSLHPDQSYLWLVSKDGYETHILPPQKEIEETARSFYRQIQISNCQNAPNTNACLDRLITPGAALYDQILAPVAQQIQGKRLLIVPDGALHYVPFAAIPQTSPLPKGTEQDYQPLLTQHEIVHAPSATAIATQRQNLRDRPPAPQELAILADPVFSATDPRVTSKTPASPVTLSSTIPLNTDLLLGRAALDRGLCTANTTLQRLPGTRREAKALQSHSPDASTVLDFEANQDWFETTALDQYQTLFFSTHGCIDSQNPGLSGLVLSLVDENGQAEPDGFLRLNEIFNLRLNADLVVLSACQTGLGETIKGEGMVGMTRGFMYAGAERVVVSLWNVNDNATAELMSQFYGTLQQDKPASAALREAQLALWEKYQEPRLWAAFTLQGEWLGREEE